MARTTYIPQAHNRAVRQASELPEEQNPERIPKPSPPPVCGDLQSPHILVGSGVCNSHCRKATKHRIKNKRFSASHNLFFSGKDYSLPQDVFMDPQNWNSNGFQYSWPGSAFIRLNIVATHAIGKTIFWRPEKK